MYIILSPSFVNVEDFKSFNMTTYTQSLLKTAERTQKAAVREFLFSFFQHAQLNKIIGLAGPNIQDYLNFLRSKVPTRARSPRKVSHSYPNVF
jgi:hypothetical protein